MQLLSRRMMSISNYIFAKHYVAGRKINSIVSEMVD